MCRCIEDAAMARAEVHDRLQNSDPCTAVMSEG